MNYMKIENNTRKRYKGPYSYTKIQQLEHYTRLKKEADYHKQEVERFKESYRRTNISGFNNSAIREQKIVDEYENKLKQIREIIKTVRDKDEVLGTYLALRCIGNLKRREISEQMDVSTNTVTNIRIRVRKLLEKVWPEDVYIRTIHSIPF